MERLTNKREADLQRRGYEIRLEQGYPRNIPEERFLRLAAYEDTGLEPEEVNRCKLTLMGKSLAEITEFDGVSIERLKELVRAEKAGRLVVLPCPMGSTIYMIVTKHTKGREPFSFIKTTELMESNVFRVCRDYGKTVFLTREEAERALEGGAAE